MVEVAVTSENTGGSVGEGSLVLRKLTKWNDIVVLAVVQHDPTSLFFKQIQ